MFDVLVRYQEPARPGDEGAYVIFYPELARVMEIPETSWATVVHKVSQINKSRQRPRVVRRPQPSQLRVDPPERSIPTRSKSWLRGV